MAGLQQNFVIRPFTDTDYPAMIELWNGLNPDWQRTLIETQASDAKAENRFRRTRFLAEQDSKLVGILEYGTNPGAYHPSKFNFELYVAPEYQGQAIGKALYAKLLEHLTPLDPLSLRIAVRENQTRALRFFAERGFVETKRDWVSVLEVSKVNLEAFSGVDISPIQIRSFAELSATDAKAAEKLHEMFSDIRVDTPRSEPATPIALEFFIDNVLSGPDYNPEAFFVALDGDYWVGLSGMYRIGESSGLDQWLTGVRRAYRGKKVALALKLRTIAYAKEHGFETIRTDNDSLNAPMLAVNEKLGFVRGAAQVSLRKLLREET